MAHPPTPPTVDPDVEHPLHFLHRMPLLTVLGDPQHLSLRMQLRSLVRIADSHAYLEAFLQSAIRALNVQVATMLHLNGEEPAQASCLTLASLLLAQDAGYQSHHDQTLLTNDPLYVPSLELIVVLGTVIAASNPMDANPVASGVESNVLIRLTKYGLSDGSLVDLSTYGLASLVLGASKGNIADLAH